MANEIRSYWFFAWTLIAAAMLAGCAQKWEEVAYPEAGFAATFPMPVMSEPKDGGTMHYWAHADDVQLQVISVPLPVEEGSPEETLKMFYEQFRNSQMSVETTPSRISQLQGHPAMEFALSNKAEDGQETATKGLMVRTGDHVLIVSGLWRSSDKNGPKMADRFIPSFRMTQ